MFTRNELKELRRIGFDDNIWYTNDGKKAMDDGATEAIKASK